ncbi:MAG: peptidoglycan-binding domain-containing protein [Candidatus Omnitrophota bacterium]
MSRKFFVLAVIFVFALSLGGCVTVSKQRTMEMQGLQNQISALEAQVQTKDEEINSLHNSLSQALAEKEAGSFNRGDITKKKTGTEVKSRPKPKEIQTALKNAGYNPGSIDGKMGAQTKEAIKAFQKANKLKQDGKVGKATWNLLREYLNKKVK